MLMNNDYFSFHMVEYNLSPPSVILQHSTIFFQTKIKAFSLVSIMFIYSNLIKIIKPKFFFYLNILPHTT